MPPATRRPSVRTPSPKTRKPGTTRLASVSAIQRPTIVIEPESLQDFNESINWCIYGDSGVGKTVLSSFAPNAYFLSTEKGVVAAKRVGSQAKVIRAPDWEHVEEAIKWANENLGRKHWLIVDSVSKMQELLILWWLRVQNAENATRDIDVPQLQDHQKWQRMFLRFINDLVNAEYNVIFIATSMHKEDPEGDSIVLPNIVGKDYTISNNFCADMDILSCLRVKKRQNIDDPREAILINDTFPPYMAKDRFHVLRRWEAIPDGDEEDGYFDIISDMIGDIMALSPEERKAAKAAVTSPAANR